MSGLAPIGLGHLLALSGVLFTIGTAGVLLRRNAIIVLMSIELMLNAVNIALVSSARVLGDVDGHIVVFFSLSVAAAEVAIGLALVVAMFRRLGRIDVDVLSILRG